MIKLDTLAKLVLKLKFTIETAYRRPLVSVFMLASASVLLIIAFFLAILTFSAIVSLDRTLHPLCLLLLVVRGSGSAGIYQPCPSSAAGQLWLQCSLVMHEEL